MCKNKTYYRSYVYMYIYICGYEAKRDKSTFRVVEIKEFNVQTYL